MVKFAVFSPIILEYKIYSVTILKMESQSTIVYAHEIPLLKIVEEVKTGEYNG